MTSRKSPLDSLDEKVDVLVVGGGITGAGIFRDLALHGIKTVLIDKKDFSSQTSQRSSKMLHGGIRYLETFNFGLVWEALHEKNLWLKLAPHLCKELPFYIPVFKDAKRPLWMIKIGLTMYDSLSGFKSSNHRTTNREQTLEDLAYLKEDNLRGAGVYYDVIVDDSQITLESIYDGLQEQNAQALNYVELEAMEKLEDNSLKVTLHDTLTGSSKTVVTSEVVFATGPFTDQLLAKFPFLDWKPRILPSKGAHIWISQDDLPLKYPVVMQTNDGRVIFVIPQKGMVLVGTTEEIVEGDLFDIKPTENDIEYLLKNLNEYFPKANIDRPQVLSSFAGIRPLVKKGDSLDPGKTARNHKIFNPLNNCHIIIGGKLTTYRTMGQKISQKIVKKRGGKYDFDKTKVPFRKVSVVNSFAIDKPLSKESIFEIVKTEHVRTFEDLIVRRLAIPGRKHWKQSTPFNEFFLDMLDELQKYIQISKDDIEAFDHQR